MKIIISYSPKIIKLVYIASDSAWKYTEIKIQHNRNMIKIYLF